MKAKLIVEGKEFPIEILDSELQKLVSASKKTGYERLEQGKTFYIQRSDGSYGYGYDHHNAACDDHYDTANYYSDETVAKNNARADKIMRQLRRFAVEHRKNELDWSKRATSKWFIEYNYQERELYAAYHFSCRHFGGIYFGSPGICELAMDTFHDELIWYFTEYKDSL